MKPFKRFVEFIKIESLETITLEVTFDYYEPDPSTGFKGNFEIIDIRSNDNIAFLLETTNVIGKIEERINEFL
jgi:hypothetical protein